MGMHSFGPLVGTLLLRSWQRAERVHSAMLSRGFDGRFHARRQTSFGIRECLFVAGWSLFLITLRMVDITQIIGKLFIGRIP